jgi:short-chain fatty acids transporter
LNSSQNIEIFFKKYVPSPFSIAILLTLIVIFWATFSMSDSITLDSFIKILSYWEKGIWNEGLLVFAYQMMLILVLGHILVLSRPMDSLLSILTSYINSTSKAVIVVSASTMFMAFLNWGLGLIFGAILVRRIGEESQKRNFKINYPLIGASGYIGLMVWHGGLSGSAPLKVSESGHLASLTNLSVPDFIATSQTILSFNNLIVFLILMCLMPLIFLWLSQNNRRKDNIPTTNFKSLNIMDESLSTGFEKLKMPAVIFGVLILVTIGIVYYRELFQLRLTPNILNFFMLGLAFILHGNFNNFLKALQQSIGDVSGILIQFPLYFGIMGVMKDSGLATNITEFFVSISTKDTLPIFSFFSAGLLNIFVPSGGGQWAIQGPIIIESSAQLNIPLAKMIMAMSYGDQITNMLQPFWALPLLAITKLKAHQILPYTFWMFLAGSISFLLSLIFIY